MSDWQPIETAQTGVYVQIGGWAPDINSYPAIARSLEWVEAASIAFRLNHMAIRVPSYPDWAVWWKPLDLNPPAPDAQ